MDKLIFLINSQALKKDWSQFYFHIIFIQKTKKKKIDFLFI